MSEHINFMQEAIKEAHKALNQDEIPIVAVITYNNEIIGRGFNQVISHSDPTSHAEILAIRQASQYFKNYRLPGTSLYVTLEPCIMCLGAIFQARIQNVFFGAMDHKFNSCHESHHLVNNKTLNHHTTFEAGIMNEECAHILNNFFIKKRGAQSKDESTS